MPLMVEGEGQIVFFWNFSPPKAFYDDPSKLRNFRESPTTTHKPRPPPPPPGPLFLITTPSFYAGFLADPENLENSEKS